MASRNSWKKRELANVRALDPNGRRFPSQGKFHKDGDDGEDGWLTIEGKSRESLPKWFLDAFQQADVNGAAEPHRLPIVLLSYHRGRGYPVQRFVMMRAERFTEWFNNLPEGATQ